MPRLPLALLLAGALAAGACGGSSDDAETAAGGSTSAPSGPVSTSSLAAGDTTTPGPTTSGPVEVPEELDFVAPDVRGGQVDGAALAGKDLVIWYWAPW